MEDEERKEFIFYLENYTPKYRKRLLNKMRNSYKNGIRNKTRKYIKNKNIDIKKCIVCGSDFYVEFHHVDYTKPYIVAPLCMACHKRQHSKNAISIPVIDLTKWNKDT